MKLKQPRIVTALMMSLLLALCGAFSLLRADNGTCSGANITLPFTDVAGNAFFCSIAAAHFSGLTNGTSPTTYSPANNVTCEQMAAFITRTQDSALRRGSRRAALQQWWTPQVIAPSALTTVGNQPLGVQADGEGVWVANYFEGTVTHVRASTGKVIETWTGMDSPWNLLVANGRVYVVGGGSSQGKLYAIDPDQPAGNATLITTVGGNPRSLAYDGEHLLIASLTGSVTNYHVPSGSKITYTNGLSAPIGMLYDGNDFWVTDQDEDKLKRMAVSGTILQVIDVGNAPQHPTFDGTNIWVPNHAGDSVTVVRAATGAVVATLTGNGLKNPNAAAFDGERILVTNYFGKSVSLWRATDLKPLGSFLVGGFNPQGVCSDGINFWVTISGEDKLARF